MHTFNDVLILIVVDVLLCLKAMNNYQLKKWLS